MVSLKKIEKTLEDKHLYRLDAFVLGVTLIGVLLSLNFARPLLISPVDEFLTSESEILFSFENAKKILIDDNLEFSSPEVIEVKDNLKIVLEPGVYYWRAEGILESEIRTLTIESRVDLKLRKIDGERYGLMNAGSVDLNVEVYDGDELNEKIILNQDEEKKVIGTKFVGGQNE
jgi:uncharacterized protein YuzE